MSEKNKEFVEDFFRITKKSSETFLNLLEEGIKFGVSFFYGLGTFLKSQSQPS